MKQSRNTTAKTEILNLIDRSATALSHSEVQKSLQGLCDRVTIYRVLDRLIEEGKIHKIVNGDGVIKYAACSSCTNHHQHDHIHFSCEVCKKVVCIPNVVPKIQLPEKFIVKDYNFVVSGICEHCS